MYLRNFCVAFFIIASQVQIISQTEKVVMSREYDKQSKSYNLIAENPFQGMTVLEVTFTSSSNMLCDAGNSFFAKSIRKGRNSITKIKPLQTNQKVDFRYSYRYLEGCVKTKPDMDHPYLIPLKQGNTTEIRQMVNIQEQYGDFEPPKDWYAITLKAEERDTVFAARRGVVTKVEYGKKGEIKQGTNYSSNRNWMSVQHKDCTTAKYQLFADDGIWVIPGEMVEVGQALGVISSENYTSGSHLRFSVTYYDPHPKIKSGQTVDDQHYYAYVPIKFHTKSGTLQLEENKKYEVELNPNLITIDMSKRELKKWLKNN